MGAHPGEGEYLYIYALSGFVATFASFYAVFWLARRRLSRPSFCFGALFWFAGTLSVVFLLLGPKTFFGAFCCLFESLLLRPPRPGGISRVLACFRLPNAALTI